MSDEAHVVLSVTVREPRETDGFRLSDQEGDDRFVEDRYVTDQDETISAVVVMGDVKLPYTGYVDWFGDGGPTPSQVPEIMMRDIFWKTEILWQSYVKTAATEVSETLSLKERLIYNKEAREEREAQIRRLHGE